MTADRKRSRLLPWFIGIVVIALADGYAAALMYTGTCEAPVIAQFLLLAVMPAVYLALMYLTLTSPE